MAGFLQWLAQYTNSEHLSVTLRRDYNQHTMPATILVVDDKAAVRQMISDYLAQQGYRIVTAANGRDALYATRHEQPDAILLDLMMPEMDGFEFLRQYRRDHHQPVIVITARDEESDTVLGLDLGADDYIIKPFRMRELSARVRAVLRRSDPTAPPPRPVRVGDLVYDEAAHAVSVQGRAVSLTPTEFNLLGVLVRAPGQVFTREQLADRLALDGFDGLERTLNVHVRNLRAKIEPNPDKPTYIETVFGVGYRLARPEAGP